MTKTVLIASHVFRNKALEEEVAVVVEDGSIIDIQPVSKLYRKNYDHVYDLHGCTLLPGLVDAHIHLGPETQPQVIQGHVVARLLESSNLKLIKATVDVNNLLQAGFTAARDVGGVRALDIKVAIDLGLIPGPRMRCTGKVLTTVGGLEDHPYLPLGLATELSDLARPCSDPTDCIRAVREQRRLGAEIIKVFVTGYDSLQQFSDDEVQTIAAEAHRFGMPVCAHAFGGTAVGAAVRAGCYTIEHGSYMTEADCKLMAEKGTIFVPDLAFAHVYANLTEAEAPVEWRQLEQKRLEEMKERTRMAYEMGVKIAAGTDFGLRAFTRHGSENILAMLLLQQAGLSTLDVLMAATIHGAETLKLAHVIGKVEPGYYADLVAVAGNPVDHLEDLRNVCFVMKEGEVVINKL